MNTDSFKIGETTESRCKLIKQEDMCRLTTGCKWDWDNNRCVRNWDQKRDPSIRQSFRTKVIGQGGERVNRVANKITSKQKQKNNRSSLLISKKGGRQTCNALNFQQCDDKWLECEWNSSIGKCTEKTPRERYNHYGYGRGRMRSKEAIHPVRRCPNCNNTQYIVRDRYGQNDGIGDWRCTWCYHEWYEEW